ncbi:MAG: choice-of-anchor Q domain-containing protein [Anaerolineales bacterium]
MSTKKSISRVYSILFILVFMLALTFSALDVSPAHAAGIRYATPGGTGDCSSWANACVLQTALAGAVSGDEIWAAAGTYKPTTGADRAATFQLKNGVALYGGFAGTETARNQRNPAANVTTLSGDIGTAGDNSDNSYHVVTGATGATLDGFTITAGNANGQYPNYFGGGMYTYSSSPTLTNVTFSGNSAGQYGGGMYNYSGSPKLTNVTFSGNSATYYGGGMYNEGNSKPTLTNVTFSGNSAQRGGGMRNENSNPTLTNVTFSGNSSNYGGGMYNYYSSPAILNTIFWGNTASSAGDQINNDSSTSSVSDSVVQAGCPAGSTCTNIITTDPKLGTLGNYGGFTQTIPLLPGSSAIDAGNDATCATTDQRGISRPQGAHCDIGAFELLDTTALFNMFLPLILR